MANIYRFISLGVIAVNAIGSMMGETVSGLSLQPRPLSSGYSSFFMNPALMLSSK